MAILKLHNHMSFDALVLPGIFIDYYLPRAKGNDVKIFLYLLRTVSTNRTDISLASIADLLDVSEKELLRSLSFWEKEGLLQLHFDSNHALSEISFSDIKAASEAAQKSTAKSISGISDPLKTSIVSQPSEREQKKQQALSVPARKPRDITLQEENSLSSDYEFNALTYMAENAFASTLKPNDIHILAYWFINFERNGDILESLLEYCCIQCANGKPNIRYFETVAAGWYEENITTAEQAREYARTRNSLVYGVMDAFGIKNRRDANATEQAMIRKWSKEYGFSNEMIFLACTRTTTERGITQNQFSYADTILTSWYKQNINTPDAVAEADLQHRKRTSASPTAKRSVEISKSAKQFHNFEERNNDYEAMLLAQYEQENSSDS